ncbi:inositol monophosphatase [Nocardia sp. CNY236]|uniref:inositol monophosphatase family protein n=1 Tax=Nocardia sp. CNY236 TaxID=1169152 RepID=UPI0003FADC3E|nr:inositol monophosphatase [Nocardia sp. CNY236]
MNAPPLVTTLDAATKVAVAAVVAAGRVIGAGLTDPQTIRTKDAGRDVVTALDLRAERIILEHIAQAFPHHRVLAEESGWHDGDEAWCWIVDPLDGTNNIAIGLPVCTVGIALCHNSVPVLAIVHEPVADRTWLARRDHGLTGPYGRVVPAPRAIGSPTQVLAWLQGYQVTRTDRTARALRLTLESGSRRLIQLWSPLLCWVMLSRGDIDGFVGYRSGAVDRLAGTLLARESGIQVTDFHGAPLDDRLDPRTTEVNFIAAVPERWHELSVLVKSAAAVTVCGLDHQPIEPASS